MRARSHFGVGVALVGLTVAAVLPLRGYNGAEDALKSATLLAFMQNARWAEECPPNTALTVGVVGRQTFVRSLQASVQGKSVNGRPLHIEALNGVPDPHCCQVLYFATDKAADIKPLLQVFSSSHVLTVGESDGFLESGGAVNLYVMDGHMAFEVSLGALGRAGVEISSKLLRFGQIRDLARGRADK